MSIFAPKNILPSKKFNKTALKSTKSVEINKNSQISTGKRNFTALRCTLIISKLFSRKTVSRQSGPFVETLKFSRRLNTFPLVLLIINEKLCDWKCFHLTLEGLFSHGTQTQFLALSGKCFYRFFQPGMIPGKPLRERKIFLFSSRTHVHIDFHCSNFNGLEHLLILA